MMTPTVPLYPRHDCAPSLLPGHACDPNHNEDIDDSGITAVATNGNDESGDDGAVTTTATPLLRETLQYLELEQAITSLADVRSINQASLKH